MASKIWDFFKFKTLKKLAEVNSEFNKKQPISGGNSFQVDNDLNVQDAINQKTIPLIQSKIKQVQKQIKSLNSGFLEKHNINPYYLLQYHASYFCSTLNYETKDYELKAIMEKVIRVAFLYGKAGIYFDDTNNKYYGVFIGELKRDIYGNIIEATYGAIDNALINQTGDLSNSNTIKITGNKTKNLLVFNWGVLSLSAWITIWPFVLFQSMLLKMTIAQSFFYNKKMVYKVNNTPSITEEINQFFDPTNIFLMMFSDSDLSNRFDTIELSSGSQTDFLDYYNEVIKIYYHIYGRKINIDAKKERNISDELKISEENFDYVQNDYKKQFEIFVNQLKTKGLKIDYNLSSYEDKQETKEIKQENKKNN